MARERGRNYPRLGLLRAIKYARMISEKEGKAPASREVLAMAMDYKGLSGASMRVLGALNQYGLLEGRGDALRLSSDAITLIDAPLDHPDRKEALNRVAFNPTLFAEVKEAYGSSIPSEDNLQYFFVKQGLPSKAARKAVKAFRETIELIQSEGKLPPKGELPAIEEKPDEKGDKAELKWPGIEKFKPESSSAEDSKLTQILHGLAGTMPISQVGIEEFKTRVGPQTVARVYFDGPVTQRAIEKLTEYLEFSKDMYPLDIPGQDKE